LEETANWLGALKTKHGITPHLMAKTAVGLGLRAEEVVLLREEQVPKLPSNPAIRSVRMEICYGTKGGRDPADPEKKGKARSIRVPVALLIDLRSYISAHRKLCLKRFRDKNPGSPAPKQLFLSKHTGAPLSYSRFYEFWKSTAQPYENFSPHIGRHMWACYTLVEKIREEVELSTGVSGPLASLVAKLHGNLVETWISPQLGHVDQKTSDDYLQWVIECFEMQSHTVSWWDYLNEQV
jgi:integrase